ncbi:MAG: sigma-70 family RNA polymerase sigma factor [Cyclobacteriaceae bacterium]|nr:sigma-70 family RNA polymerase sigma factor [Cyclobacteriaceae bacterium]
MKQDIEERHQVLLEEEVIRRAQTNPKDFRFLYEKYFKPIFLFVLHRVGDKDLAGDLTSQVFLKAMVNLAKYQFRGFPFSAWLYRIAVNECNDFFRRNKRARLVVLTDESVETLYEEMFGHDLTEELKVKLPVILQMLKPDELQLIELRFLEGKAFKEVSEILDISENYAKVRTYRILDKMRKLFTQGSK